MEELKTPEKKTSKLGWLKLSIWRDSENSPRGSTDSKNLSRESTGSRGSSHGSADSKNLSRESTGSRDSSRASDGSTPPPLPDFSDISEDEEEEKKNVPLRDIKVVNTNLRTPLLIDATRDRGCFHSFFRPGPLTLRFNRALNEYIDCIYTIFCIACPSISVYFIINSLKNEHQRGVDRYNTTDCIIAYQNVTTDELCAESLYNVSIVVSEACKEAAEAVCSGDGFWYAGALLGFVVFIPFVSGMIPYWYKKCKENQERYPDPRPADADAGGAALRLN